MTAPVRSWSAEDIARSIYAAETALAFNGPTPWNKIDLNTRRCMEHGVRVVQEGGDEKELVRQYKSAFFGGAGLDKTPGEWWHDTEPSERRYWLLFTAMVRSLSDEDALSDE